MTSKWPKRAEIEKVLRRLAENPELYSRSIPKNAPLVDQMKRDICAEFIVYRRTHEISQRELAQRLGIGEALISKILHYRFDEFTLDRLIRYLEVLGIKFELKRVS